MLQCGKLKASKKANSEAIREEPKGMRYMEENNKQPGLDPEAKTEKLEATPADKGAGRRNREASGNGDPRRQAQGREDGDRRAPYREVPVEAGR